MIKTWEIAYQFAVLVKAFVTNVYITVAMLF